MGRGRGKLGIRDGSFSHFSSKKWEKEPSLIPSFPFGTLSKKWEKEPSLIPSFSWAGPTAFRSANSWNRLRRFHFIAGYRPMRMELMGSPRH